MIPRWRTLPPVMLPAVLAALLTLTACSRSSVPQDEGSGGGSDGGETGTANLVYGCNWLFRADTSNANIEYPDSNAVYWVAALPDTIPSGDHIEIAGASATVRYFSFEVYSENGEAESSANDADIVGQSAAPAAPVASGQPYTVSVIYSLTASSSGTMLVANPAQLSTRAPAHKFLFYRLYLPTSGAADFDHLPTLTYVAAGGTRTPLAQTPDQASCNTINNNIQAYLSGTSGDTGSGLQPAPAVKPPKMTVFRSTGGRLQNLDAHYMYEKTNDTLGDLLLVRGLAPAYATGPGTAQVRYWSVCSDEFHAPHRTVQCLADKDAHLGTDGYYNVVIATDTPPDGYAGTFDYLPFGTDAFGQPIYRQLLADPGFTQSIAGAALVPDASLTMGDYYPQTAYCSRDVFSTNLSAGAAAVFAACKASQGIGTVPDPG